MQAPPWAATDRLRVYMGRVTVIDRAAGGAGAAAPRQVIDVPPQRRELRGGGGRGTPRPGRCSTSPVGVTSPSSSPDALPLAPCA
ncbi:MAG: hypothetical protein M5U28_05635 [Sandaracinaceae bacterium]|nr:hypothetical protein [Sandaracinaceae bacterium]